MQATNQSLSSSVLKPSNESERDRLIRTYEDYILKEKPNIDRRLANTLVMMWIAKEPHDLPCCLKEIMEDLTSSSK